MWLLTQTQTTLIISLDSLPLLVLLPPNAFPIRLISTRSLWALYTPFLINEYL